MKNTNTVMSVMTLLLLGACADVEPGNAGVRVNMNEVEDTVLDPGTYATNLFTTRVVEIPVQTAKYGGRTSAFTSDLQQTSIVFVLTYRLDRARVVEIYKTVGVDWANKLIPQQVLKAIKDEVGLRKASQLVSARPLIQGRIERALTERLAKQGIIVEGFQMVNIDFSAAYEAAIEAKEVAVQNSAKAVNDTVTIREQAQQQVIRATAQAESMRIRAQALAQNPGLVEYEAVQKWDGKLPVYMLGGTTPFINLNDE